MTKFDKKYNKLLDILEDAEDRVFELASFAGEGLTEEQRVAVNYQATTLGNQIMTATDNLLEFSFYVSGCKQVAPDPWPNIRRNIKLGRHPLFKMTYSC